MGSWISQRLSAQGHKADTQRDSIQTHSLIPEPGITALLPNSKSRFRYPPSIPGCCHLSRAYSILSCAFFCGSYAQPVGHLLKAGPLAAPGVPSMCDRVGHAVSWRAVQGSRQGAHLCCRSLSCSLPDGLSFSSEVTFLERHFLIVLLENITFPRCHPVSFLPQHVSTCSLPCVLSCPSPQEWKLQEGRNPIYLVHICTFSTWNNDWQVIKCTQVFVEEIHEWTHWNVFEMLCSLDKYWISLLCWTLF